MTLKLREDRPATIQERRQLLDEIERLRAALKPFADAAPQPGLYLNTVRLRYSDGSTGTLSPADFLDAQRALEQTSSDA